MLLASEFLGQKFQLLSAVFDSFLFDFEEYFPDNTMLFINNLRTTDNLCQAGSFGHGICCVFLLLDRCSFIMNVVCKL